MPTHTRTPQPPLPPTPKATASSSPAAAHRRQRTFSSSSSSSSSSSLSTASSAASSPTPSPRSRGGAATRSSTTTATATSVPFSWEHHPGIPKTRFPADAATSPPAPLPLPPPLRAPPSAAARRAHRRRAIPPAASSTVAADPFAAALAECTRDRASSAGSDAGLMDSLFPASPAPPSRRWSLAAAAGGGVGGFLDLRGCKSAMAVAEGAFIVRRPVAVARHGHGRAGQGRPGRAARR